MTAKEDGNTPFPLKNPPVVEAILGIECEFEAGKVFLSNPNVINAHFSRDFPKQKIVHQHEFRIEARPETEPQMTIAGDIAAVQQISEDEKSVVQLRSSGFTFNRLSPYTTFEEYLPMIVKAWTIFSEFAKPIIVTEVKLSFVNEIKFPLNEDPLELEDYFTIARRFPAIDDVAQLQSFAKSIGFLRNSGIFVAYSLATKPIVTNELTVILGIETWIQNRIDVSTFDLATIESLRIASRETFTRTITDKCLQLFQ